MARHTALTRDAALAGLLECAALLDAEASGFSTTESSSQRICDDVVRVLAHVTAADRVSLMVMDEESEDLLIVASLGVPEEVAEEMRSTLGRAIRDWVAENGESLLLVPGEEIPEQVREAMAQPSVSSSISVPISWDGGVLGVLNLGRLGRATPFERAHLEFAALVGQHLGHFRSLSRLRRETSEHGLFVSQIIESIPSSLLVVDRRLRVISANRHFLQSIRRGHEATIGRRLVDVLPSWLTKYAPVEDNLRAVFRSGEAVAGGDVLQLGTGNVYFFRFVPMMAGGAVQQAMLLIDDVTDRHKLGAEVRRAERHLAGVVQSANDLLASLDDGGRIVTWNPAAERVSGWSLDEVRGRRLWELCTPDDADTFAEMLHESPTGRHANTREARLIAPDGRESIVDWSSSPMTDDNGVITGTVVVGRDLTSYRLLASQLIQAEKMASLGVMAGGIAHELRTPLAVIQVSAQLLLESPEDLELQKTCLSKIDSSTKRSALIIENLLRFARPQTELQTEIDVDALLDETLLLLADQLTLQRVKVRRTPMPDGIRVVGNADLLQQVFTNLVLNACTSMPEGGKLGIVTSVTAGGQVKIAFHDSGVGIPAKDLAHVFDPFFTTKPPGSPSSGLGLSISYKIMEQHGGGIEVASELGKGSTFTVSMPAP